MPKEKSKRFDPAEFEAKATAYENLSRNMNLTDSTRKYFAGKAKSTRRVLAFMDRAGWFKRSGKTIEKGEDHIERR